MSRDTLGDPDPLPPFCDIWWHWPVPSAPPPKKNVTYYLNGPLCFVYFMLYGMYIF